MAGGKRCWSCRGSCSADSSKKTAARLDALQDAGFAGAVVNNPAQLRYTDGWTLYGGLGLNVTNPMSAARYASLGGAGHAFAARDRANGHAGRGPRRAHGGALLRPSAADADPRLPPAQCARLRQMPGRRYAAGPQGPRLHRDLLGPRRAGVRTVFNPVPLYMGERLRELPVDVAVAAFTTETPRPRIPDFGPAFQRPTV